MEYLTLFWNFDTNNYTKIIAFIIFIIVILCVICKPKNKNNKSNTNSINKNGLTNCQIDHKVCQENKKRGNNNICVACKPNGNYPNKIYNPKLGWVNVDPVTGRALSKSKVS